MDKMKKGLMAAFLLFLGVSTFANEAFEAGLFYTYTDIDGNYLYLSFNYDDDYQNKVKVSYFKNDDFRIPFILIGEELFSNRGRYITDKIFMDELSALIIEKKDKKILTLIDMDNNYYIYNIDKIITLIDLTLLVQDNLNKLIPTE